MYIPVWNNSMAWSIEKLLC